MTRYAERTSVSSEKSRIEIERCLQRYGASEFGYAQRHDQAAVVFTVERWRVRFNVPLPSRDAREFTHTPKGRARDRDASLREWEQACRQRWRALALVIKAKLEAVETGVTTFEEEFLAHLVLPNGQTAGAFILPQIEEAVQSRQMPPLLPWMPGQDA